MKTDIQARDFDVNGAYGGIDAKPYRAIGAAFDRLTGGTRHSLNRNRRLRRKARQGEVVAQAA